MKWFAAVALLGVLSGSVAAQQSSSTSPAPTNANTPATSTPSTSGTLPPDSLVQAGPYQLAPGDVISITSIGFPQFDAAQMVIPPDGNISPVLINKRISVVGMTTNELAKLLQHEYSNYVVNPDFTVTLVQKRSQHPISFYGAVSGNLNPQVGLHIIDALARLGGDQRTIDLSRVVVTHANGQSVTLDLSHPEDKAQSPDNILLQEGDNIYLPVRHSMVEVTGEVTNPGAYKYHEQMTVMEAIADAGNFDREKADLQDVTITHDGKTRPLSLYGVYHENNLANNITLHRGDSIFIPKVKDRVYFLGEVNRIGYYNLKPGDHLLDALTQMGPSHDADLSNIRVVKVSGNKKLYSVQYVNIQAIEKGDGKGNILLEPGEVIFVPKRGHKFGLSDVLGALTGLNLLDGAARLVTGHY